MTSNYRLGEDSYKTKKEIANTYQSILNSYRDKEIVNREDSIRLYHLLQEHPSVDIKLQKQVSHFFVDRAQYGTRCFYLKYKDETHDDFSYTQCIKNIKKLQVNEA